MKEYPAITFEIVHQREDGELERIKIKKSNNEFRINNFIYMCLSKIRGGKCFIKYEFLV